MPCIILPEVPAVDVKRTLTVQGLRRCGAVTSDDCVRQANNAERDCQAFLRRSGLSLPIKIRQLAHQQPDGHVITTEYVNPTDWLELLVEKYDFLLAGGSQPVEQQLLGFWNLYRYHHPSHAAFAKHGEHLHKVWPICFFGDEGKGPKRACFMVCCMESAIGLADHSSDKACACEARLESYPSGWIPDYDGAIERPPGFDAAAKLATNYKGHSFLTRFLLFGLPGFLYDTMDSIVAEHLENTAKDFIKLFDEGVTINGEKHFAALVASKGDLKFQAKTVANLYRCYGNLGKVNDLNMCSFCLAGQSDFPFEDVQHEPSWSRSLFASRPWHVVPSLARVPFDQSRPEWLFKADILHVFKVGVGRDIVGSSLLWILRLGLFDAEGLSKNIPDRLTRAHSAFKLWCLAERKSPGLRSFTRAFMNAGTAADSAWSSSKGSDTMLLLSWLAWLLRINLRDPPDCLKEHLDMLQLLLKVIQNSLAMFDLIHGHGLFLPRHCAQLLYCELMTVVRGYKRLAAYLLELRMSGFRLKPKLHALHHIAYEVRHVLQTTPCPCVMSPISSACEVCEDFTGRICTLSRKVSTRTIGMRTFQRYFFKTKALIKRHKASRATGIPV